MKKVLFYVCFMLPAMLTYGCSQKGVEKVNIETAKKLLTETKDFQLIDVRTPSEYAAGHLKGAINMDINGADFDKQISSLNKSKTVMVYCLSGGRSSSAASMLSKNGFSKIYDLPGIMSWRNDNYPLETAPNALPNNGLNLDAYDKLIHSKEYVLVDFNATWCKPCKIMAPYLAKHAQERNDKMILAPVDADANPEPVKSNGIDALPTLILYHNGQQIWRNTGLIEEEKLVETLAQWVK